RRAPTSTLFPYTTLFRSFLDRLACAFRRQRIPDALAIADHVHGLAHRPLRRTAVQRHHAEATQQRAQRPPEQLVLAENAGFEPQDRKSTRLNSSHVKISY